MTEPERTHKEEAELILARIGRLPPADGAMLAVGHALMAIHEELMAIRESLNASSPRSGGNSR